MDLHCHTSKSYDVFPVPEWSPAALYTVAKKRGMDFVTFTDHDTMDAFRGLQRKDLVPGCEFTILDKSVGHTLHVNAYLFTPKHYEALQRLARVGNLRRFARYCRDHNLPFQLNHPYWAEKGEWFHADSLQKVAPLFDVVEVNAGRVRLKNELAIRLAKLHGKGVSMGSDSHSGGLGTVYTLAPGDSFRECWENIARGHAAIVRKDLTVPVLVHEVNTRVSALFSHRISEAQLAPFRTRWRSGIKAVDSFAMFLLACRRFWLSREFVKRFAHGLSYSRLPAYLYLRSENRSGKRLKRELDT